MRFSEKLRSKEIQRVNEKENDRQANKHTDIKTETDRVSSVLSEDGMKKELSPSHHPQQ